MSRRGEIEVEAEHDVGAWLAGRIDEQPLCSNRAGIPEHRDRFASPCRSTSEITASSSSVSSL
jgi:hypothetical protein